MAAEFCAYQSMALELIRTKKRKETRFQLFMQVGDPRGAGKSLGGGVVLKGEINGGGRKSTCEVPLVSPGCLGLMWAGGVTHPSRFVLLPRMPRATRSAAGCS